MLTKQYNQISRILFEMDRVQLQCSSRTYENIHNADCYTERHTIIQNTSSSEDQFYTIIKIRWPRTVPNFLHVL